MDNIQITPLTTNVGAKIDGIDLRQPISDENAEAIRQALAKHAVLVFKGQPLTLDQHKAVTRIFGPLEGLPSLKLFGHKDPAVIIELGLVAAKDAGEIPYAPARRDEYQDWHTDSAFTAQIPSVACLRPEVIPPSGGDTCWTSMAVAYDALSPALQAWLETLTAVHAAPPGFRGAVGYNTLSKEDQKIFEDQFATRSHPVVVRHPTNGRKLLFVNPTYTAAIDKLNRRESTMLLRFLFNHLARPDFIYRHRWSMGDIVIWDELATLHLGPEQFAKDRRLVRITAGLTTPTAANPDAISAAARAG